MRKGWMVFLVMILVVSLLTGCSGKQQPPVENGKSEVSSSGPVGSDKLDEYLPDWVENRDKFKEELKVNEKENMNLEEIQRFILATSALIYIVRDETEPASDRFSLIGTFDDKLVLKYTGKYETMDKAMLLMGDYFSPRAAEKELWKISLVNLNGRIGYIIATEEEIGYSINEEKSRFRLLEDGKGRKVVETTVNVYGPKDIEVKARYILDRINGRWLITEEIGLFDDVFKNPQKKNYLTDWESITSSPLLVCYKSESILYHHTSWMAKEAGGGIGEWIEFASREEKEVSGVDIKNGYEDNKKLYPEYNRVKRVRVELSDGSTFERKLQDDQWYQMHNIDFGRKIRTSYVKITVLEVYKGSRYDDTYISEVRVY